MRQERFRNAGQAICGHAVRLPAGETHLEPPMTCLISTSAGEGMSPAFLAQPSVRTAQTMREIEDSIARAMATLGRDLFSAAVRAASAQGMSQPDAGDIEYASWMPDPGALEIASWNQPRRTAEP